VRIVIVSDTHSQHEQLGRLRGDVLIHSGDSANGFARSTDDVQRLDDWFGQQDFSLILCTGGNHDFELEERSRAGTTPVLRHAEFLVDRSVHFRGLHFYGAPWTPELDGWAFYLPPREMRERWARIPEDVDVLITHTPPQWILDRNRRGRCCGCPDLAERLLGLRPRILGFGHVHASAGTLERDGTTYVNASMVNSQYQIAHRPHELDLLP
jgi:Icc-related predicted phosphoesterase